MGMVTSTLPQTGLGEPGPNVNILARLIAGAVDALEYDRASTRVLLQQAIAILQRVDPTDSSSTPPVRKSTLAPWQVKRVAAYISAHLDRPITLCELADVARL